MVKSDSPLVKQYDPLVKGPFSYHSYFRQYRQGTTIARIHQEISVQNVLPMIEVDDHAYVLFGNHGDLAPWNLVSARADDVSQRQKGMDDDEEI